MQLAKKYGELGYFLNDKKELTNDARLMAQASILNITFVSRDHSFLKNFREKNPEKKIEQILNTNRRCLGGDFNGCQAKPRTAANCLRQLNTASKTPRIQNFEILDNTTEAQMINEFHYKPSRYDTISIV